jgi:hypothetical protein
MTIGLIVLGAGLSLIATLVVQWWVVPRVVRETRARERWDEDVLRLGDVVAIDLARRREEAFDAWQAFWGITDAASRSRAEFALRNLDAVMHEVRWCPG